VIGSASAHAHDQARASGFSLDRIFALAELLDSPGFWERAAAAGAGESSRERHRLVDEAQRKAVIEVLDLPRSCRRSHLLMTSRAAATGALGLLRVRRCGAFYCPDCGPPRKAAIARDLAACKDFRSVITITMPEKPPELGDPESDRAWDVQGAGIRKFRRLSSKIFSFCSACRNNAHSRVDCGHRLSRRGQGHDSLSRCVGCEFYSRQYGGVRICPDCWVATVRKKRNCPDCAPREVVKFFACPEWNTHLPGRRGRFHNNFLSDVPWGYGNKPGGGYKGKPELSAVLKASGLGKMTHMTPIVDVSHAVKDLARPGADRAERRVRHHVFVGMTEATRYTVKDLDEGARPGGRVVRIPKGRRRFSSNVIHLPRHAPDPRFLYRMVKDASEANAWGREYLLQCAFGVPPVRPTQCDPVTSSPEPAATAEPPPSAPPRAPPHQFGFGFPFPH
jgi:hypothetical protein